MTSDLQQILSAGLSDRPELIAAALREARERTRLIEGIIPAAHYQTAMASYLSPPNWDFAHIANFEELWLLQRLAGYSESSPGVNDIYDAFMHERKDRPALALLDRQAVHDYQDAVREAVLTLLPETDFAQPLTRDGFVHWMVVMHEHQHQETILQSMAMMRSLQLPVRPAPKAMPKKQAIANIPGGTFMMGRRQTAGVYDNESPPHAVTVSPFWVTTTPATVGEYLQFVEAGGYQRREYWSADGWAWVQQGGAPMNWHLEGEWMVHDMHGTRPVREDSHRIMCHLNYFEAAAFARSCGGRLPTEPEWEYLARNGGKTLYPWGDEIATPLLANVDHLRFGTNPAGIGPANEWGVQQLLGDVWEWTSSPFSAYPNSQAFPYAEYSQVFYDKGYRVLRGGCWASRALVTNGCFRNWDVKKRQQIFAGVRVCFDAPRS